MVSLQTLARRHSSASDPRVHPKPAASRRLNLLYRDGSASGSAIKEAHPGSEEDGVAEQMVFCEFSLALPLMVSYLHHNGGWKARNGKRLSGIFASHTLAMKA